MMIVGKISHYTWYIAAILIVASLLFTRLRGASWLREPRLQRAVLVAAWVAIASGVLAAIGYFLLPRFYDHIEPHVVITALNAQAGLHIHPDWTKGEGAWGTPYGPFLYEWAGLPLMISKTVMAAKLASATAFLFAIVVLWRMPKTAGGPGDQFIAAFYLLAVTAYGPFAFWVRSEPLLLALTAAAVLIVQLKTRWVVWLGLGVVAGLAAATKFPAVFYFAPIVVYAALQTPSLSALAVGCLIGLAGFALGLVAPFADDPGEARRLAMYVTEMTHHGLSPRLLAVNLAGLAVLASPYGLRLWKARAGLNDWRGAATPVILAVSILAVAIIGAKPGSGPHHLMPFIPVLLYLTLLTPVGAEDGARDAEEPEFVLAMLANAAAPLLLTLVFVIGAARDAGETRAGYREAADLAARYPGAQFGPTDDAHYEQLYLRVAAAFHGARLSFDNASWTDLDAAGLKPADDAADFAFDRPRIWILPKAGQPFTVTSRYTRKTVFPPDFQAQFLQHCQRVEVRTVFAVWRCTPQARPPNTF
jgi:hypothetical protein